MKKKIKNAFIISLGLSGCFFWYMCLISISIGIYEEYLAGAFASNPVMTADFIVIALAIIFSFIEISSVLLQSFIRKRSNTKNRNDST